MKRKHILTAAFILAAGMSALVTGQQNVTLYYMQDVPQSNLMNPAYQHMCKLNFGGLAMPIGGQVMPPMYFNMSSNSFSVKQMLPYDKELDSLLHPLHPKFDYDKFYKRLKKVMYLSSDIHINYINVGYRWKDEYYFTFSLTDKIENKFSFPKDYVRYFVEGNGDDNLDETFDFSGLGISSLMYREFSLGASKKINSKLTLGVKAKILFGIMHAWTRTSDQTLFSEYEDFDHTLHGEYVVNISQPFYAIKKMEYDYETDSMIFELDTLMDMENPDVGKILMPWNNPGLALDFGAVYEYDSRLTLYGSLLDIGLIRWKNNPHTLRGSFDTSFDGYDITHMLQDNDSVSKAYQDYFVDSMIHIINYDYNQDNYTTFMNPKIYLGGTYKINDMFTTGALWRGELWQHRFMTSFTLTGQVFVKRWFSGTLSYSVMNSTFTNVGAGAMFKVGPTQFYLVTDNVFGFIWPQAVRDINLRWGINLVFGCKKRTSETLIN